MLGLSQNEKRFLEMAATLPSNGQGMVKIENPTDADKEAYHELCSRSVIGGLETFSSISFQITGKVRALLESA